jgi:hypothetical protein
MTRIYITHNGNVIALYTENIHVPSGEPPVVADLIQGIQLSLLYQSTLLLF